MRVYGVRLEVAAARWLAIVFKSLWRARVVVAVALVMAIGGASGLYVYEFAAAAKFVTAAVSPVGASDHAGTLAGQPSIAVLPFKNMSADPILDYLSDGITEDLTTWLSQNPELLVISRTAAFAYKGKSPDVREVGRELGARYVLEGSVRKDNNRVWITTQLIDAASGHHVWAQRYDEEGNDVVGLQDAVTDAFWYATGIRLLPAHPTNPICRSSR